jgi:putative transposase
MKASKFTEGQKAFILRQGEEGTPVAEICRKAGISQATYFNWKKRYGGLLPDEMRRLKALEDENGRLKKIVADLTLDREMASLVRHWSEDNGERTSSAESSEAWPDARIGSRDVHRLGRIDPRGLWGPAVRHLDVPLQVPAH